MLTATAEASLRSRIYGDVKRDPNCWLFAGRSSTQLGNFRSMINSCKMSWRFLDIDGRTRRIWR